MAQPVGARISLLLAILLGGCHLALPLSSGPADDAATDTPVPGDRSPTDAPQDHSPTDAPQPGDRPPVDWHVEPRDFACDLVAEIDLPASDLPASDLPVCDLPVCDLPTSDAPFVVPDAGPAFDLPWPDQGSTPDHGSTPDQGTPQWTVETSAAPAITSFHDVGPALGGVFAVGSQCTVVKRGSGTTWQPFTSPSCNIHLQAVWGNSTDLFVAGDNGYIYRYSSTTSMWDSGKKVASNLLAALWGASTSDLLVVGDISGGNGIWSFDGSTWTAASVPRMSTAQNLRGVWGMGNNRIAVGKAGTILTAQSGSWSQSLSPTANNLRGVWGSKPTDLFIVGDQVLLHAGPSWSMIPVANSVLHAVWGTGTGQAIAVGSSSGGDCTGKASTANKGVAYALTVSSATLMQLPNSTKPLCAVYKAPYGTTFAVGDQNTIISRPP